MASSCRPSYHVEWPRWVTSLAMMIAKKIAPISKPLNTKAIGNGPITKDASTSTGATNRAICAADPTAMLIEMSIRRLSRVLLSAVGIAVAGHAGRHRLRRVDGVRRRAGRRHRPIPVRRTAHLGDGGR